MVMAINNAALLTQPTDISNLTASYRDGQKLRQEYDARQHKKALNELMKLGTYDERLQAAQQHKYAGALVPAVQQYEEARDKANLEQLKTSADIGKVFGETRKLGAEADKTYGEADKIQLETARGIQDHISAVAISQNPKVFGLGIGELYKRGLLTQEQTQGMLKLITTNPENASAILQQMAMTNQEVAKIFKPEYKETDAGDKKYGYSVNSFTGEANEPSMTITKGTSPDVVHQGGVSERNNIRTTDATRYASDNTLTGTKYTADTNAETKMFEINQKGEIDWFNADTDRIKATTGGGTGGGNKAPKPAVVIKMQNEYQTQLKNNAATLREVATWAEKIANDELQLGFTKNAFNAAANRTGVSGLGSNPQDYASFNAFLKDLANKALRLNAGVQTDADYARQLEGMIAGSYIPRDKKTALALLNRIQKDFTTANKATHTSLNNIRKEYGEPTTTYGSGKKKTKTQTSDSKGKTDNKPKISPVVQKYADEHFGGR